MMNKLRISVVVALVVGLAACGAKKPVAAPDNAGGGSGSAMAPSGATGGHGYGGTGYGGKR